jgi:hypothetical protein
MTVNNSRGKVTISGHDSRSHHTYFLFFEPPAGSGFSESTATRKLTVR